jgi:hypothetical protein
MHTWTAYLPCAAHLCPFTSYTYVGGVNGGRRGILGATLRVGGRGGGGGRPGGTRTDPPHPVEGWDGEVVAVEGRGIEEVGRQGVSGAGRAWVGALGVERSDPRFLDEHERSAGHNGG